MEKAMTKLELAPAAFFPAPLLRGAAMGKEEFDESLGIAYAMAMLQMARPSGRPGLADPEDGPGEPGRDSGRSVSPALHKALERVAGINQPGHGKRLPGNTTPSRWRIHPGQYGASTPSTGRTNPAGE